MSLTSSISGLRSREWRIANSEWLKSSHPSFPDPNSIRYSLLAIRPSPPQIHLDHPLIRRNLIDGSLRQHGAFVQAGDLDAEFADEGHVMFDDHDRLVLVDFLEQLGGLMGFDVGHPGNGFIDQ